jgi:amidophosphoribosyltransferase
MPQDQRVRDMVARMKLVPIHELIHGKRILFCEDSIVRGTQLRDTIRRVYESGAKEIHMRPACPPLIYGCKFLNFSRSRSDLDLAGRRAIREIEGSDHPDLTEYAAGEGEKFERMVELIRQELNLTSLRFQRLPDLVRAIGLPKEQLCTYCWDGKG